MWSTLLPLQWRARRSHGETVFHSSSLLQLLSGKISFYLCLEVCLCMILFLPFLSYSILIHLKLDFQAQHRLGTSFWCLSCIFLYQFHFSFFPHFAEDPAQGLDSHKSQSSGNRQCPLLTMLWPHLLIQEEAVALTNFSL